MKNTHERTIPGADHSVVQAEPFLGALEDTVDGGASHTTVSMGQSRRDGVHTAVVDTLVLTVVNQVLELATAAAKFNTGELQTPKAAEPVASDDGIGHISGQGLTVGLDDVAVLSVPLIGTPVHGRWGPCQLGIPIGQVTLLVGQPQGHEADEAMQIIGGDGGQGGALQDLAGLRRLVLQGLSTAVRVRRGPEGLGPTSKDKDLDLRVLVPEGSDEIPHLSVDRFGEVGSDVPVGDNVTCTGATRALGAAEPTDIIQEAKEDNQGPVDVRDAEQGRQFSQKASIDAALGRSDEEEGVRHLEVNDGEIIGPHLPTMGEGSSSAGGPDEMTILHLHPEIELGTAAKVQGRALSLRNQEHHGTVEADQLGEEGAVVLLLDHLRQVGVALSLEGVAILLDGSGQQLSIFIGLNCKRR